MMNKTLKRIAFVSHKIVVISVANVNLNTINTLFCLLKASLNLFSKNKKKTKTENEKGVKNVKRIKIKNQISNFNLKIRENN